MLSVEQFLGTSVDAANSTKVKLIPERPEGYRAQIATDGIGLASFKFKKGDRAGQPGYRMTVKWEIDDPDKSIEKEIGRKPIVTQSIMLDITSEGALDMGEGKNVQLGRLREAIGQNANGRPWAPAMLIGQMARINIKHRINDETGDLVMDVDKVVAL